jgi:hypothetical protein
MENDRRRNAGQPSIVERVESRLLMSAGGAAADARAAVGGALRGDSYVLVIGHGDCEKAIGGTLKGDTLVIHTTKTTTVGGHTGQEVFVRIGANTIGGSASDRVSLVLRGNTIGGELTSDGIRFFGNTIGGTFHPDTYVVRLNTVGGVNQVDLDWVGRVGANTIGGAFVSEPLFRSE